MATAKKSSKKKVEKFIWSPYTADGYMDFGGEVFSSMKDVMDSISNPDNYSPDEGEVIEVYQLVKTLRPKKQEIEFEEVE